MFGKVFALGATFAGLASAAVPADEIINLPGWDGDLPSRQYSGYLDVGAKHFHYWLILSENAPATDPVVLWLNGGPGCSSLDGLVYEHGPFRINDTDPTKLYPFEYAWSKQANMLYLEAPVGVGFSYSDDKGDYITNDDKTASDNVDALNKFYELYPEYKDNKFFITGESYAGVYVPTLAEGILFASQNGTWNGAQLEGIAVGNGCIGSEVGVCGGERPKYQTEYLLESGFIPKSLKEDIKATCTNWDKPGAACELLLNKMSNTISHVNLYNIYGDCISGTEEHAYGSEFSKIPYSDEMNLKGPDACINSISATAWMTQPEVIEAIHVVEPPFKWSVCGNQIRYTSNRPNLPRDTYPALIKNYKVVIYNGDWDACVPYTDNEAWTEGMGFQVADAWHPWLYKNGQVAGYATRYADNDFTFITIRGGRHEVPESAPEQAFEMLRRLLAGENF